MRLRPALIVIALVAGLAAGCGGGDDSGVPNDAVAVVGDNTITKAEYDELLNQAQAGFKAQGRKFPKPGTSEYEQLKQLAIQTLVQREQVAQEADDLGVEVTDEEVDKRLDQYKRQYFAGNEQRYREQLKEQGLTDTQVREDVRTALLSEELQAKVTEDVKVTNEDVERYYRENRAQYKTPDTREIRHILVKQRSTADRLYRRLKNGGNFAALASRFSQDPGSKGQGGKLTMSRGAYVKPFENTAFALKNGEISRPVKTRFGFHIIQALSATKRGKVTPLSQVREAIRQQLLQTKKQDATNDWLEEMRAEYKDKIRYQVGYAPPKTTDTTATR